MPSKTALLFAAALTLATSVTADANRPRMYYPQRAKRNVDTEVQPTTENDEMKRDLWSDLMKKFQDDQEADSGVTTVTVEQTIWVPPPGGTGTASVQPISEPPPTTSSTQPSRTATSSSSRSGTLVGPGGIIFPSPSSTPSGTRSTATDSSTTSASSDSQTTVPASVSSTSSTGGLLDPINSIISGLLPDPSSSNTTSAASETGSSGVKSTTDSQTTTSSTTTTTPSPTGTGIIPIVTSALSSILDPTTSETLLPNSTSTDTSSTVQTTDTTITGTGTTTLPTTTPTLTPTDGPGGNTTSTDTTVLTPTSTPTSITTSGNATETQTTTTSTSTDLPPTTIVSTTTSSNGTVTSFSNSVTTTATPTETSTLTEPTTTQTGVTSITPTAGSGTSNWLPTTIIAATSTFTFTAPTASESAATTTALPSDIPKVIVPAEGDQPPPKGSVPLQIGFKYALNYDFVASNPGAAGQIFKYLSVALSDAAGIPVESVTISRLVPYDTRNTLGYLTTLAKFNYPETLVDALKASLWAPNSKLYNNPLQIVNNLTALINPTIDLLGNNDDEGAKNSGSSNSNGAVGSGSGQSNQSPTQMGRTAGIVVGAISFAGLYGAAMFIVARRYKRKRQSHRRASSVSSFGHSAEMQFAANGSPALMTGALISPNNNRGTYGGQSQNSVGSSARTAGISAPVAAENSLGWN